MPVCGCGAGADVRWHTRGSQQIAAVTPFLGVCPPPSTLHRTREEHNLNVLNVAWHMMCVMRVSGFFCAVASVLATHDCLSLPFGQADSPLLTVFL